MPFTIQYTNDSNLAEQKVQGSDGRLNVSARSDGRIYYNSRDISRSFSLIFDDASASALDDVCYLKNTDSSRELVIHAVGVNSIDTGSIFRLKQVTGTQVNGAELIPSCLNRVLTHTASATAAGPVNSNSSDMTGLVDGVILDQAGTSGIYGHEEFRIQDAIRLGQDDAVAIELFATANADSRVWGVIFFYYEE